MFRSLLILCLVTLALCPVLAAPPPPTHLFYTGMVGKYPIQCSLGVKGTAVNGQYTYLAFGDPLVLTGTLNEKGVVTLHERDVLKKTTGSFTGRLSADRRKFTGTWSSTNGKHHLAVALNALAEYRAEKEESSVLEHTDTYPVFYGNSTALKLLNDLIARQVAASRENGTSLPPTSDAVVYQNNSISIAYYQPDLVSLLIKKVTKMDGKNDIAVSTANYKIGAGKLRLLTLDDLFNPKTNYRNGIRQLIQDKLQFEWITRHNDRTDIAVTPEVLNTFTLAKQSITFVFADANAKLLGRRSVSLSYMLMQEYLNPHGPLARFLSLDGKDPVTELTAEEALKLGAIAFSNRYTARTKDDSTAGMRNSLDVFTTLVKKRNDAVMAKLPKLRQTQCRKARELLYSLVNARYDAQTAQAGGGTMWLFQADVDAGGAEETLAEMLTSLSAPAKSPTARTRMAANLKAIDANFAKLRALHVEQQDTYITALQQMKALVTRARSMASTLPDAAADSFIGFVKGMVWVER